MKVSVHIRFAKSTSPKFAQAVQLAASLPGYRLEGEDRVGQHLVALEVSLEEDMLWRKLERLLHLICTWRSTQVQVAKHPIVPWRLRLSLARIKECFRHQPQHEGGDYYCSGKNTPSSEATCFGCRLADSVSRSKHLSYRRPSWIEFGTLSAQRDGFSVDKPAMHAVLQHQVEQEALSLCPAFSWQRLQKDLNELPDTITLGPASAFEIRYADLNPNQALGIQLKKTEQARQGLLTQHFQVRVPAEPAPQRCVPNVRYADIAGQEQALAALKHVVQLPLLHADYFQALKVTPQAGILLYGPPGNGKTLLAKAVATESQAHLEIINGPEILSKWVGESEANLRAIFARCRALAPSVLLIDEIDSLAPRRERLSQQYHIQLLSQLLVLLDGLESRGRVAVVAATNRLEALDPAICRPGRLDYHLEVPLPNEQGREAILRVHLRKLRQAQRLRLQALVRATVGYSGADLAGLCREAALQAILRSLNAGIAAAEVGLIQDDLSKALQSWQARRACAERTTR